MMSSRVQIGVEHPKYKWLALSNTTLGMLLVTINSSIVLISLPAIFKGIDLNPLSPGNVSYLLWMLMGFMLVSAVLVVPFGRLGDMIGRVRTYNLGFVVFTVAAVLLSFDPFQGGPGAIYMIALRVVQGVGGAMLMANSTAILTDAFPVKQRGMALGVNMVAAIAGSFLGLVLGGVLSEWDWRAVFWVSVPFGIVGAIWSITSLKETGEKVPGKIDWIGTLTFAVGLIVLLTAVTYGIQPYGGSNTGWTNPWVLSGLIGGFVLLIAFCIVETKVKDPIFHLELFKNRAFGLGNLASWMASIGRGGMQFMLIIWLQGIWLPLHGYSYESTPLWAGIFLVPLTIGFLVAGPIAGWLSDHYGARWFATGGALLVGATFIALVLIPVNFPYWLFALLILLSGVGSGLFSSPNTAMIMSSVPAQQRGAASGMRATFFNSGSAISIGLFFSLMVVGLANTLPSAMHHGLVSHGVSAGVADNVSNLPPVGMLFAAFLGYNPMQQLIPASELNKPGVDAHTLTGQEFFPHLMSGPFHSGLVVVFVTAGVMMLVAALASYFSPKSYTPDETTADAADAADVEIVEETVDVSPDVQGEVAAAAGPTGARL
ncbi:MFS transporter [Jongsikchunia kroppenstedtii]|uniref:MFS transporter n=1 Tax=Jongsikchunia kroppenstedtii TaxID=1121721 RepID=UPI00036AAA90|nr:MFS transporter [Jongsikchunia kroppenstedtii]